MSLFVLASILRCQSQERIRRQVTRIHVFAHREPCQVLELQASSWFLLGRRFLGIEREEEYAAISKARREEIENLNTFATYKHKIPDIVKAEDTQTDCFACHEDVADRLPFLDDVPVAGNNG